MNICFCEIQKRWPNSTAARVEMLIELERRGLLSSEMKNEHGAYERFWKPLSPSPRRE